MTHLFYNAVPPFSFEIALQMFFKIKIHRFFD
jgi:hypothetical protein